MYPVVPFLFETFINIAEVSLFFYFITHQLKMKQKYIYVIPIGIIFLTSAVTLFNCLEVNRNLSMLFFLGAQLLFTLLTMEGSLAERFLWGCSYIIVDMTADSFTFFISSVITGSNATKLMSSYPERYVLTSVYLLLLVTFVFILTRNKKQRILLPRWLLVFFCLLVIVGVVAIESLLELSVELPPTSTDLHLYVLYMVITIFLFVFLFIICLIMYLSNLYQKNLELMEASQLKTIEENQFNLISNTVETLRTWKHDSKQYLSVLEELINHQEYDEASKYIHELCWSYEKSSWEIFSGNSIVDSVISSKLLVIRQNNIKFTHSIYLPKCLPFDNISLSSLLGNLFDNAIEACLKLDREKEPYIDLKISPMRSSLRITMKNSSMGHYILDKEGFPISTKQSPNHGIGLKRIRHISEEVGGFCQITPQTDTFLIHVVIPIPYERK